MITTSASSSEALARKANKRKRSEASLRDIISGKGESEPFVRCVIANLTSIVQPRSGIFRRG